MNRITSRQILHKIMTTLHPFNTVLTSTIFLSSFSKCHRIIVVTDTKQIIFIYNLIIKNSKKQNPSKKKKKKLTQD